MIRFRSRIIRRWTVAVVMTALISFSAAAVLADVAGHGGIVSGVTARGSSGFLSARVTNPFDVAVHGYINFQTLNANGSTTTTHIDFTLDAYGSQNFPASGLPFTSSTVGAQVVDGSGLNSATGWGNSSGGCSTGCSSGDGGGGGGHGTITIPDL